jgi:hypothetical protein
MKTIITFFAFALFLFFLSCGEDSPTDSTIRTYKYTGYDSSWNKVVSGYLWIDKIDSVEVTGRWDFKQVGITQNIGPQIGKGIFKGASNMFGTLSLNLNPGFVDNNVFLNGSLQLPNEFNGSWQYIGFPGQINWGRFKATQLR